MDQVITDVLENCLAQGGTNLDSLKSGVGIALESRRLDWVERLIRSVSDRPERMAEMLNYCLSTCLKLICTYYYHILKSFFPIFQLRVVFVVMF